MNDRKRPEERITDAIIESLERGVVPWKKPWESLTGAYGAPAAPQRITGEAYQGINFIMLAMRAAMSGYTGRTWMTYRQAAELGGQVRKGETSTLAIYYGQAKSKSEGGDDSEGGSYRFLKGYPVFNVDQIDGLDAKFYAVPEAVSLTPAEEQARLEHIEAFISRQCADLSWRGDQAYYAPGPDHIRLPEWRLFRDGEQAYATALHELVHWTAHKSRLERDLSGSFGSASYAFEELVADIGACYLGQRLGLRPDHIEDHASYIGSWLKKLRNDPRMILKAASQAQAAADFLWERAGMAAAPVAEDLAEAA